MAIGSMATSSWKITRSAKKGRRCKKSGVSRHLVRFRGFLRPCSSFRPFSPGPRVTRRGTWREFRMRGTSVMPLARLIAAGRGQLAGSPDRKEEEAEKWRDRRPIRMTDRRPAMTHRGNALPSSFSSYILLSVNRFLNRAAMNARQRFLAADFSVPLVNGSTSFSRGALHFLTQ